MKNNFLHAASPVYDDIELTLVSDEVLVWACELSAIVSSQIIWPI